MFNFKVAQLKAETKEYEVELEEKLTGEHHCGSYRVTEMKDDGRKQNYSTFQSTLGFNEEDWEAFIRISSILKVPFSERDFEASISRNEQGEETATIVWNESVAVGSAPSCTHAHSCGHTLIVWNRSVTLRLSLCSHIGSSLLTNVQQTLVPSSTPANPLLSKTT